MADESFIPPGQEALVGAMLGSDATLPGDCKLLTGNLQKTTVEATYACSTGEVVVQLANPANAPANATRTDKFAIWVARGTAPADLQSTLVSRIRERESQFRWITYSPDGTATPQRQERPMLSGVLVLGLLALAALLLWRRRTATRE